MKTAIIDAYGKCVAVITAAPAELIDQNTPVGGKSVPVPDGVDPYHAMYVNGSGWQAIPPAPNNHSEFNWVLRAWKDTRTLDRIKSQHWDLLKNKRDDIEFGGFVYKGISYDSDSTSQSRIMIATITGTDQVWTTKDNKLVELSSDEFKDLYLAMQDHISSIHKRSQVARQLIDAATTVEEVEKIEL